MMKEINQKIKILLIEDDEDDFFITKDILNEINDKNLSLEWSDNKSKALQLLKENSYQICLLDYRLGQETGLDVLKEIKTNFPKLPVIMLTGKGDKKIDELAMKTGASDYLVKGEIKAELLERVIRYTLERKVTEKLIRETEKLSLTGRLARTIAHEIRNPLTNIRLGIEQMQESLKDIKEVDHENTNMLFTIIDRNCNRIQTLITELLNSSKPAELNKKPFNLNNILEETIQLSKDRMTLNKIQLKTAFDTLSDLPLDKEKMTIAFLNIILNATEAVRPESGVIDIKTINHPNQQTVIIRDNGIGMSKTDLQNLFDPFFSKKPDGIGLGLTATHNIITNHRGTIEVESIEGKGTSFIINFSK